MTFRGLEGLVTGTLEVERRLMNLNTNRRTVLVLGTPTSDDAAAPSSDGEQDVTWFEDGRLLLAEACIAADGWKAHAAWSSPPPQPPMICLINPPPPGLLDALATYAPDVAIQESDPLDDMDDEPPLDRPAQTPAPITPDEIAMLLDTPLDPPESGERSP